MKKITPETFREYDIRGVVDKDFDPEWVELLGRALGTYFVGKGWNRAVIGHDCRASSPEYQRRLASGLTLCGVDVVVLNQVSTPMFYYAVKSLGYKAGVMITASHNPSEYNGFKVWGGSGTIYSREVHGIYEIMAAGEFVSGRGMVTVHDIESAYMEELAKPIPGAKRIKVVVDGGNGAGGEITARMLEMAGAEVVRLYCEPDGNFPNHHPDPVVVEYTADLRARVLETGAHAGLGLDGDGDRIGVVNEKGELMFGDQLLAIYSREMLKETPGATVIGDVKCSHLLFKDIEDHGGQGVMCITGHSLIKAEMRKRNAALAGEMSGHMFFADRYYGFDDASYAALRLLEILAAHPDRPLSEYLSDWPQTVNTPEIRLDCPEEIKFKVVERAVRHFKEQAAAGGFEVLDIDGARLVYPDGWGLVRASNTQGALVLRFEAESAQRLEEIRRGMEQPLVDWIGEMGQN